jgi:Co/Zn/Cd efflux system component
MTDAKSQEPVLKDRERDIRRVLWIVLGLNIAVALAKLLYGLSSHSVAMQADGIHSFFDGASNVVGLIGMWFAARPADQSHPYGHGKFETFTAAAIALMLGVAGYTVARGAISSLQGEGVAQVGIGSFAVMISTLAVNLGVTTWEARAGRRLSSEVLVADSRHTLSDVLVSSGVIVSLIRRHIGAAGGGCHRLHGLHDSERRRTHTGRCRAALGHRSGGGGRWCRGGRRLSLGANAWLGESGVRGPSSSSGPGREHRTGT